jgi:GNAT superfamily N-acetyltransferase
MAGGSCIYEGIILVTKRVQWRGAFKNSEVSKLHAHCFGHRYRQVDWWSRLNQFSLGWVCVRNSTELIGFVNVAWDGGVHAFVLDAMVAPEHQRQGVAKVFMAEVIARATEAHCEWLHVDFEPHLDKFYLDACGFRSTAAGLISLN